MTDAPERIWASEAKAGYGDWQSTRDGMYRPAEYIRLDLHEAAVAAAHAEGMREAAEICNERGKREEANFGLTRATQNYYRARDCIRTAAAEASK